jgi:hypothetical protein
MVKAKMKLLAILLIFLSLAAFRCEDEIGLPENCDFNTQVESIIESSRNSGQKTLIELYENEGSYVYAVNTCVDCADTMTDVYNCDGVVICRFGGIAGFNTCPDFYQTAKLIRIVWKN